MASRVTDFTRMNPPEFYGSKVEEDPQEFIDEVYKIMIIMGVTQVEKAELAAYNLKGVAQILYNQWKEGREAKVLEFINIRQGSMSVAEYDLKFNELSKYDPTMVVNSRAKNSMFVSSVSEMVVKECPTAMIIHDMDISRLMRYSGILHNVVINTGKGRDVWLFLARIWILDAIIVPRFILVFPIMHLRYVALAK
ncbi:hypothetical protein MTR67_048093 [Solanum verrucosum]|uniref:Gag-pol polyprotein n=1 Tax=Solanum verrucosum TaxID=315347 RepID=A0AAF0ZYV1_SOLVR|nr:hypothetical protein MTR67_048093 [Solanum verrucosum]